MLAFETVTEISSLDPTRMGISLKGNSSTLSLHISSFDQSGQHPDLNHLTGKKLRVFVEVLGDEEAPDPHAIGDLTDSQLALLDWRLHQAYEADTQALERAEKNPTEGCEIVELENRLRRTTGTKRAIFAERFRRQAIAPPSSLPAA